MILDGGGLVRNRKDAVQNRFWYKVAEVDVSSGAGEQERSHSPESTIRNE